MFKGNEDSSQSQNELDTTPIIQKSLVIDPVVSVDHLICSICFHIVWSPVICGTANGCHNAFCNACINSWLQSSNKLCPTCKKPFVHSSIPPILNSVLEVLNVKCPNHLNGCNRVFKYLQLGKHIRLCQYKIQKCKGCKNSILQKDYLSHTINCDQFIVQCQKCKVKMTKAVMKNHSRIQCFSKQIATVENRVSSIKNHMDQITSSLQRLETLTNNFLQGEPLQLTIQFYTSFSQHFIFPNPTLVKPSFNPQKQKFDFLHFYVLNPIYTDSIASIKWAIKVNKMIGNLLIGFCSSMTISSVDYIINKYGDLKRKDISENKYRMVRESTGFSFACGDLIKFRYVGLDKCIKIWNETKRVGMVLQTKEIEELGQKIYAFYSMDTLNDSISFV